MIDGSKVAGHIHKNPAINQPSFFCPFIFLSALVPLDGHSDQ